MPVKSNKPKKQNKKNAFFRKKKKGICKSLRHKEDDIICLGEELQNPKPEPVILANTPTL